MTTSATMSALPLTPFYLAAAIAAAGLLMVLRPGRAALRRSGAVIGLAGFGLLLAQALTLAGPASGGPSTPFFLAFSAIGVIAAVRVITHPRPVFAALYFILTVIAAAAIFLMLEAEFLAFALIIVYAGAILITYLFVLMLANQSPEDEIGRIGADDYDRIPREPMAATLLGFFLVAALGSGIERASTLAVEHEAIATVRSIEAQAAATQMLSRTADAHAAMDIDNVQMVGVALVSQYPASLELAGVILLMAMFGAVVLARRQIELGEDDRRRAAGLGGLVMDIPRSERGGA